jgi:hypothetical protein
VEADIKNQVARNWKIKAQGRKERAAILREAKAALKVPQNQRKNKNNFQYVPSR